MVPAPFSSGSSYPVRVTPAVDYLVDGEASFAAIADAIEAAQSYVYITCCYVDLNFRLRPPNQEQLLDLCQRTAARGVRVALLFWQPVDAGGNPDNGVGGTVPLSRQPELEKSAPAVLCRWDQAKGRWVYPSKAGCHHQKTFIIDGQLAFVGGINMTQNYWDTPAHKATDERRVSYGLQDAQQRKAAAADPKQLPLHDLFSKFTGPAVSDVEANFVERWNGATHKANAPDLTIGPTGTDPASGVSIQVLRTIAPQTYPHTANGDGSIKQGMLNLLNGATESVYFENQYFFDGDIAAAMRSAALRGVRIVGLLAREPDAGSAFGWAEKQLRISSYRSFQATMDDPHVKQQLQLYSPFTEGPSPNKDIYVHAKAFVVDERYVLLGSANISFTSLDFHSEMSILVDDAVGAKRLLRQLFCEHLCIDDSLIPKTFAKTAELWKQHGAENKKAQVSGQPLASRVVPLLID